MSAHIDEIHPADVPQEPARAGLFHALRAGAERMSLRTLERRGFRNVQVLNMMTIENIVAESLTHILERRTAVLSIEDRIRLEREAKSEFARVLADHQRGTDKSDEVRERETAERQLMGLRAELARQKVSLDAELKKNDGSTLVLSPESLKLMEDKIRTLFASILPGGARPKLSDAGPGALEGLSELEREVAAVLDRLLSGERERFVGSVRHGQSETVELLEKRILKLNKALANTEGQLQRVSEMKQGDPGIASIYTSIQGLSSTESQYEKKKEMLEIIFNENLAIQKNRPKRRGDAAAAGPASAPAPAATASPPRAAAPPTRLVVPARFEAAHEPMTQEVAI